MSQRPGRALAALASTLLLAVAAGVVLATLAGWRLQVVESGSMEPTFPVGSLTVVTGIDPADLEVGRSVVFANPNAGGRLVSHRVVRRVERPDGLFFETRGDANPAADPFLVAARDVRGTVRWSIPRAGSALAAASQREVALALVVVPLLVIAAGEIRRHQPLGSRGRRGRSRWTWSRALITR
jgi:signal peptidase I